MYDRNLGSYVWCGTGQQARPRCKVCEAQMLPVIFGSKDRYGGRGVAWVWGGTEPKPDSPYWVCNQCDVSYMVGERDSLKFPSVEELPEHIQISKNSSMEIE